MSRNATAAARRTRCSTASVPISTGASGTGVSPAAARGPVTSPTSAPSNAASSSRSRLTPARNVFIRSRPQAAHTTGRVSSQRGQRSTSSPRGCAAAAPQRAHRASSPQWRHASRRAPPVRLYTQTSGPRSEPGHVVENRTGQADELLREHAAARVGAPAVDPFQDGPTRTLLRARRCDGAEIVAGSQGHRRHR